MIIFLRFAKLSKTSSEREILRQQIQAIGFDEIYNLHLINSELDWIKEVTTLPDFRLDLIYF